MKTLKNTQKALLLALALASPLSNAGTAILTANDLGQCVLKLIHEKTSPEAVTQRLANADRLRIEAAKAQLAQSDSDSNDLFDNPIAKVLIPYTKQEAYEVEAYHSSALLDYDAYHWGRGQVTSGYLDRLGDLYRDHISDKANDFTAETGFLDHLNREKPAQPREASLGDDQPLFVKMMFAANGMTDRFVRFLLQVKDKRSILPWDLIKKTTDLYDGDAITALAIIGYTFDVERVSIVDFRIPAEQRTRSKRLYLGSRIKPLFSDGDALGQNYHFWMYVNAALQGKSRAAKLMSLTFQNLVGNSREQQADNLGLSVGDYIRNGLLHPPSSYSCPLDQADSSSAGNPAISFIR